MTFDVEMFCANMPVADKIARMRMMMGQMEQVEVYDQYVQGGGVGAKTVHMKAGTLVDGGMHRFENMNIMSSGEILIVTDGKPIRYVVEDAPIVVVSPPGTKRFAFVLRDTNWTTILPTNEKDVEKVWDTFIVPEAEQEEFLRLISAEQATPILADNSTEVKA